MLEKDLDGSGAFEETVCIELQTLADGSTVRTERTFDSSAQLLSRVAIETSADGRVIKTTHDSDGDGVTNQVRVLTIKVDGSASTVVTDYHANGSKASVETTGTSWDGLERTRSSDLDGDGDIDETATFEVTNNADGSRTEVLSTSAPAYFTRRSGSRCPPKGTCRPRLTSMATAATTRPTSGRPISTAR